MLVVRLASALVALALAAGCAKHDDAHEHAAPQGHVHTAPHGGTLVELGEHAYNIELLADPANGRLSAWILDGHAENFVRVKATSFEAVATVGGEKRTLTFKAVANPATGETVGDTSQFDAEAAWLKATPAFAGTFTAIEVRGSTFTNVPFALKK
jgi:hypothetical protein